MVENPEITPELAALIRQLPDIATRIINVADQLSAGMSSFNETRDAVQAKLDNLRDTYLVIQALVEGVRDAFPSVLSDAITPVREELAGIRAQIMDRIDRLQGTVELLREDITVNWSTANTAFNRNMSTRDDVDNVLQTIAAMERRYRVLMAMVEELREQSKKPPNS